jgi:hypothetical protein
MKIIIFKQLIKEIYFNLDLVQVKKINENKNILKFYFNNITLLKFIDF